MKLTKNDLIEYGFHKEQEPFCRNKFKQVWCLKITDLTFLVYNFKLGFFSIQRKCERKILEPGCKNIDRIHNICLPKPVRTKEDLDYLMKIFT